MKFDTRIAVVISDDLLNWQKLNVTAFTANRQQLRALYDQAIQSDIKLSIYTQELFATPDDEANRAAVRAVNSEELNLVGIALRGRKKTMDNLLKGLSLHP